MLALLITSVCLHAQGNKWTCPEADTVAVCQNLDEAQLGNLTCADRTGLANSATSRHAVLDMLSITHGSDCPAKEDVRISLSSHLFSTEQRQKCKIFQIKGTSSPHGYGRPVPQSARDPPAALMPS